MMSYINETDFVIENKKLVYPEIVTDGLQLYYDAKGKRDTDYHRDTMLDMSGNKNHGKLHNFAYEKHSGYKDGLVFDYIDDKLVRPTLDGIDTNDFTYQLNSNILTFTEGQVKTVKNGDVEIGGRNYLINTHGEYVNDNSTTPIKLWDIANVEELRGQVVTFSFELKSSNENNGFYASVSRSSQTTILQVVKKQTSPTDYKKYEFTFTFPTDELASAMMIVSRNSNFPNNTGTTTFRNLKLEKGSVATDWTPAPEDLIETTELKGNILGDMENIIDGLYKTEVLSGEEIYTDKADDAVVHVEVDGKSYQHAGSGKNLFPSAPTMKDYYHSSSGAHVSSESSTLSLAFVPVVKGKVYSWNKTLEARIIIMTFDSNKEPLERILTYSGEILSSISFNENVSFVQFSSYNSNYDFSDFQFEEGTTATAYEPPAPTPDYPIEIHSLNDFDVVSSQAINMFNSKDFIKNGIDNGLIETNTTLIEVDGYSGFQHSLISYAEKYFDYLDGQFEENTSYTLSFKYDFTGNKELSTSGMRIRYTDGNFTSITFRGLSDSGEMSIETDLGRTVKNISVRGWAHGGSFKVWKISLIKTSDFKEFVPHAKDISEDTNHPLIDKINLLLDEPLRSVEDVKDRLFRDNDGLWKVERNVGESVYDGSDDEWWNFQTSGTTYNRWALTNDTGKNDFNRETILSSHFNMMVGNNNTPWHGFESRGVIYLYVSMDSDLVTTPTWRAWLSENPVTVLRKLAEPHVEILSQSLQDKLNNLRSFEDSNYVYTVLSNENNTLSDNLKPTLHAKFLYNNWYKEDRVINNLMIYNRALTNEEMLQNYKTIKRRWGM